MKFSPSGYYQTLLLISLVLILQLPELLSQNLLSSRNQVEIEQVVLDLSGEWEFRLDPENAGIREQWWSNIFMDKVLLPGSIQEEGYGSDLNACLEYTGDSPAMEIWKQSSLFAPYREPGQVKLSWALNPPKHYVGAAWFRKEITIPENWVDRHLLIFLERVHWVSELWVDGIPMGQQTSLSVPHTYDLAPLKPGVHTLTLKVDNQMYVNVGPNAHSVTDQTQTNWNGVIGRMELQALPRLKIRSCQIYPDPATQSIRIRLTVDSHDSSDGEARVRFALAGSGDCSTENTLAWKEGKVQMETLWTLDKEIAFWDEFNPQLHCLVVEIWKDGQLIEQKSQPFGMRSVGTNGKQITINGKNTFIRGTLQNAQYPMTGYPPMDVESWKKEIRMAQSYGLNHYRFHSWCPPEAAFQAADELGFYLQPEGPAWPVVEPGSVIGEYLYLETSRILETYGNHPSFVMFSCGNEFGGDNLGRSYTPDSLLSYQLSPPVQVLQCFGAAFLSQWVPWAKHQGGERQLITSSAGWPYIVENDFHIMHEPYRMRYVFDRIKPNTITDYSNLVEAHEVPLISHETGQWCAYPDFSDIEDYTGYLNAGNLDIFFDLAVQGGIASNAADYHMASGVFQSLQYKQELEALFRTKEAGGFQLLGLTDYHGHGFAPVGVTDALFRPKEYIDPSQFRRFCSEVVPLALMEKRVWMNSEVFKADLKVAQYSGEDLPDQRIIWEIRNSSGELLDHRHVSIDGNGTNLPRGELVDLGEVSFDLKGIESATSLNLRVRLTGSDFANDWDFWVYPAELPETSVEEIHLSRGLDASTLKAMEQGKKILLVPESGQVSGVNSGNFESIFWSTWSGTGTLGILCNHLHPSMKSFPTEYHSDWQWWELLKTSLPIDFSGKTLPDEPIVQVIDNWVRAHQLGLIFECRVGESKVLVCAMDILSDLDHRVVARQLKYSLLNYMESLEFTPSTQMSIGDFTKLLGQPTSGLSGMGAKAYGIPDLQPHGASAVLDGEMKSYWEGSAQADSDCEVVIELPSYEKISGVRLHPNRTGPDLPVVQFALHLSHDGSVWYAPEATGLYPPVAKTIEEICFEEPRNIRFIKIAFTGINSKGGVPYVSIAEVELVKD